MKWRVLVHSSKSVKGKVPEGIYTPTLFKQDTTEYQQSKL